MKCDIFAAVNLLLIPLRLIKAAVGFSVFYPFLALGARARVCVRARIWHNGAVNGDTKPAVVCLSVSPSPYITPK